MNNFYAVFDIVQPDDDFSIVAVFSKEQDALDYPVATHKSIQKLPMEVILKILVKDRLNVCSEARAIGAWPLLLLADAGGG